MTIIIKKEFQDNLTDFKKDVLSNKMPYYANYISQIIDKINSEVSNNTKDFIALINCENIRLESLEEKVDIEVYINYLTNDNEKLIYEKIYKNCLYFFIKQNSINQVTKNVLITYFPIGYLHKKLFNLFISISSLKVDIELLNEKRLVKMVIEGEPSREDIQQIANSLIKEIDNLFLNEEYWFSGYVGIMQLIFIAKLSKEIQNR